MVNRAETRDFMVMRIGSRYRSDLCIQDKLPQAIADNFLPFLCIDEANSRDAQSS